jgi:copper chaperone CopZ
MSSVSGLYAVRGMTCEHCRRAVTEELSALPGVESVTVDLATGAVEVVSTQPLSEQAVREAVEEAGYALA